MLLGHPPPHPHKQTNNNKLILLNYDPYLANNTCFTKIFLKLSCNVKLGSLPSYDIFLFVCCREDKVVTNVRNNQWGTFASTGRHESFELLYPGCVFYSWDYILSVWLRETERNVLFNDALNTFYLQLYVIRHMVKDHSDSEKGNPLPPHRLLLSINSKGSFICTIPQTG